MKPAGFSYSKAACAIAHDARHPLPADTPHNQRYPESAEAEMYARWPHENPDGAAHY
jgi:hypothetical protein